MYKLITSARDSDDLSIGPNRNRDRKKQELTNNKGVKGKYYLRIMLRDVFGFAEHHEKSTYGMGYNLILPRNTDNTVLSKANATIVGL